MESVYDKIKAYNAFEAPSDWMQIKTIDMHTGGEPLRVILSGFPELKGNSVLEYRSYCKEHLDHLRTALMFEPRGHADMYGCILVPPNDADADFGILFLHNEGYSTMCGHAIIAISTLAVQLNWVDVVDGENMLSIDAPCGRITSYVTTKNGVVLHVRFHCVPSFVVGLDREVFCTAYGKITYDLAYGGAFYAYVDMQKNLLDFDLSKASYQKIIQAGMAIKRAVMEKDTDIVHPYEADLGFLYGTIFIDETTTANIDSKNVCVFAEGEVDRCPTGSGVSGRMAIHKARKELEIGGSMLIESITNSIFKGSVVRELDYGPFKAVIPQVEGTGLYYGNANFCNRSQRPYEKWFYTKVNFVESKF